MGSKIFGSGVLPGKILIVKIIENTEIDAYFMPGYVKWRLASTQC